jgi:hypothetical protein
MSVGFYLLALMIEAGSTSVISVNYYETTWRIIPQDSYLYTRHGDNIKSHKNEFTRND